LVSHARAKLGRRQDQANCQAESVVQSVLVRELGEGADSFDNEAHLQGRLRRAVDNKIKDRLKGPKGRTGQASQYAHDGLPDPGTSGPGTGTQIAEIDRADSLSSFLTAGLDASDQEIVRRAVLADQDANEVAQHVPLTPAAIRKRLERLRPALRKRLLEPIRDSLSAQEWAVVSACLIERMDPKATAELLGITPEQMARTLETIMREHLSLAVGQAGVMAIGRLLGRVKTPASASGDRSQHDEA
jgi:DNA-directed RNA polymerase specialized sigma24 family protein